MGSGIGEMKVCLALYLVANKSIVGLPHT